MDDLELSCLFTGYGFQVHFVEYGTVPKSKEETTKQDLALNKTMGVAMDWAYTEIRYVISSFFS